MAKKYVIKTKLESCGVGEYSNHPLEKSGTNIILKANGDVKSVNFHGIKLINSSETFVKLKNNQIYQIEDIISQEDSFLIFGKIIYVGEMDDILLAYEIKGAGAIEPIRLELLSVVGHMYIFEKKSL